MNILKKYVRTYKDTIAILDKFKKYLMFRYYFNMTRVPLYILNGKIQDDFNFRWLQNNVFGIVKAAGFFFQPSKLKLIEIILEKV